MVPAQDSIPAPGPILRHWMTPEELLRKGEIGKNFVETDPPVAPVRNVAEFDQIQGALIAYPFGIPLLAIKEMTLDLKVTTIVESLSEKNLVIQQYLANGIDTGHCNFLIAPTDSYWTRDYGPWFVSDSSNQIGIVDFPYNRPRPYDDEIPKKIAAMLGIPWYGMNLTTTGGNYMTDGLGIGASTTLVWDENPSLSHQQIAQKVNEYLGIETYYLRTDLNPQEYIKHIDCWGKFLAPDKILLKKVNPSHPNYTLIENEAIFWAGQICSYGYPFKVFRVRTPNDQPYTNSVIVNNKVLVPFMGSNWDDSAKAVYEAAMPGYIVKGFIDNFSPAWESTDALHCRVMGIADVGQLYIRHIPISGNQSSEHDYMIDADILACSHQPVKNDSVFIHYKINQGAYNTSLMLNTGSNHYRGTIRKQPAGSVIRYYLSAADQSGRHSTIPLIGAGDPFKFQTINTQLTLVPDTLWYNNFVEAWLGLITQIHNNLSENVTLTTVQDQGFEVPWWVDSISAPSLPHTIVPGDSVAILIKVPIPVANSPVSGYYEDSLRITSSVGIQHLVIMINPEIINAIKDKQSSADLKTNFPNPFSTETNIPFTINKNGKVILEIFDLRGVKVRSLIAGQLIAGHRNVLWNGIDDQGNRLPGGIYLYKLTTERQTFTKRMVLIR
jgi:agmatine/peptidylarginine deiminase